MWWKPAFGPVGRNPGLCGAGRGRSGIPPSGCMAYLQGVARKRLERRVGKGGFNWRSAPQLQPTCPTQRRVVCGVGDARRVRAGRFGAFGLKPTLARSPEKGRLCCGGNLLSGPWAATLTFAGQDAEEVASRPAAVWRICRGWQGNGWKGVLERAASIGEARPNCSQPVSLNGGLLAGSEMPGAFVSGGLEG